MAAVIAAATLLVGGAAAVPASAQGASGSNARSGPAEGGTTGTVSAVSGSGFTVTTATGETATVTETPTTSYAEGSASASSSAVTAGAPVLVLGTVNSTAVTASQVIVQPPGSGSTSSTASQVVPFQSGAPSVSKQVGQVPANYTEGSGTIVGGTSADKATEAALAAYPGGVVDRVVQLGNGEYEVHFIGVDWPHHVFVTSAFTVAGAD
ncbi:hypothetical protein DN069_11370 [Streptacidiphilus pinicola]|uniref:DUF5666 domain-containing protein n=1 Tax=Streptacidiphilus pinicola TaxID=2219663 RepID=A0A2X0ILK5_9ACTN|nr:hypothetical protein DN069_11370 [Streptacidiphilus pinicola]